MSGHIFCIMGKSSTGKDTLYKLILEEMGQELKRIVSYTTRPIRIAEKPGEEYFFVDEEKMKEMDEAGKIIECRCYNTMQGPWYYFTADDGNTADREQNYIIIGTLESFLKLKEYYGSDRVVPIYIEVEDGVRLQRALKRELKQENPKYEEMCRRFLADQQDFSKENLEKAGINNVFNNENDRNDTTEQIKNFIRNYA